MEVLESDVVNGYLDGDVGMNYVKSTLVAVGVVVDCSGVCYMG